MKAVILAGGRGTRLAPFTENLPKPLVPLGGEPILELIVRQLVRHGCSGITLAVGHQAEKLSAYFGDGARWGVPITYSQESQPLGTAGPLSLIPPPAERVIVMNGDILTTLDFTALLGWHQNHGALCTVAVHPREVPIDLGVVEYDARHRLTRYTEKPVHLFHASMGIYVFEPRALAAIPFNQRLDLPDLMRQLALAGESVLCYPFSGYWRDIGNPADYAQAEADIADLRPRLLGAP